MLKPRPLFNNNIKRPNPRELLDTNLFTDYSKLYADKTIDEDV